MYLDFWKKLFFYLAGKKCIDIDIFLDVKAFVKWDQFTFF